MIFATIDEGSALVASTAITAFASIIGATIALRANRNARQARRNTEPNGGTSSHDQLIGRIDGWGMTLERQIKTADDNARAADRNARLAVAATKQSDVTLAAVAEKLDGHLVSSAEFGGQIVERGLALEADVAAIKAELAEKKVVHGDS